MTFRRILTRRSFLARVAAGGLIAGIGAGASDAEARSRRRPTVRMTVDSDPRDPARPLSPTPSAPSRGRARTGLSDTDAGPDADPANYGQRGRGRTGLSDNDSGSGADPIGHGQGHSRPAPVQRFVICPGNTRCPRRLP